MAANRQAKRHRLSVLSIAASGFAFSCGLCALLPVPLSQKIARTPSTTSDRFPLKTSSLSILPEPVERPLNRYLYKRDKHYDRIVPHWELQHKTMEQHKLYEGDFSLFIKELTDEGAIVQDITTGAFGWVPEADFGTLGADMVPGDIVHGAKCTYMDTTVIESPDPTMLRLQTGIVYEWDEAKGEGYIIPSEGQDAFRMIRVLRRDIRWHDSRRLFPGQFLQFETALPDEVNVPENSDPQAPVALRVRGLEIRFSLQTGHELIEEGTRASVKPAMLETGRDLAATAPAREIDERFPADLAFREAQDDLPTEASYLARRDSFPASSGHIVPNRQSKQRMHPVLQRFAEETPEVAQAESPSWLWEPQLHYLKEERYDPVLPLKLREVRQKTPAKRIMTHEVALERGDAWREPASREWHRQMNRIKPPSRKQTEKDSIKLYELARQKKNAEIRSVKRRIAAKQKESRGRLIDRLETLS